MQTVATDIVVVWVKYILNLMEYFLCLLQLIIYNYISLDDEKHISFQP